MSEKEILVYQFARCYDQNGWFSCLKHALKNVMAEQANWKTDGADNSIREIINHLNYYNNAYLERFKGIDYEYTLPDNDATFDDGEGESWEAEVARFEAIMDEWRGQLESADEAKFAEMAPPREVSWAQLIADINAHNAHHGGQIVLLRKLQGSWDSGAGIS